MPTPRTKSRMCFKHGQVHAGDCLTLARSLTAESIDLIITSPPYWGQRRSTGVGVEEDPRDYLGALVERFEAMRPALKPEGLLWINLGDSYNTPVNWRRADSRYSSLGPDGNGLDQGNSAYVKPRHRRRAFVDPKAPWLRYGNLLGLPFRLIIALCDRGYFFRGEVIWSKANPMPEGRCRRPHRAHEGIYLLSRAESHRFTVTPPVRSVWEFSNDSVTAARHYSRFPQELPKRCIAAYGKTGADVVVLDPFAGSGTTGVVALSLGCAFIGFEIDPHLAKQANRALRLAARESPTRRQTTPVTL